MTISTARHHILLHEQTAVAQKVFEAVPMQEAWSSQQIHAALQRTTRTSMDYRVLQGCLNTLKVAGLVHEPRTGLFDRVKPREPMAKPMTEKGKETARDVPASLEMLGELADRLRDLAGDLDSACALIAEENIEKAESLRKLEQLRSLLKNLT